MKTLIIYFFLGWTFAPIVKFVEKYVYNDWEFLKFLFVICIVDTALGFFKAIIQKNVSSKGFSMVFSKLITYMSALITTHVLVSFTIDKQVNIIFSWFNTVVFSAIIVREAISIFENIAIIQPGAFPKKILSYLKYFDSITGKLDKLKPEKDQQINQQ